MSTHNIGFYAEIRKQKFLELSLKTSVTSPMPLTNDVHLPCLNCQGPDQSVHLQSDIRFFTVSI